MSTRSTVLIKRGGSESPVQYYHHWDGYPEYVGKYLASCMFVSKHTGVSFEKLLNSEGGFEEEDIDLMHGDLEYIYTVDLQEHTVYFEHVFSCDEEQIERIYIDFKTYGCFGNKLEVALNVF